MFVQRIFPRQIHLFKMHIFIHLLSVDLNTGVKSEITFLPELEQNSVRVKNRKQNVVNYTELKLPHLNSNDKIFSVTAIWHENVEILDRITISRSDSPVRLDLTDSFCFAGFCPYWRGELCYQVATSSSSQLLQLTGDSDRSEDHRSFHLRALVCISGRKEEQEHTTPAAYTLTGIAYLRNPGSCSLSLHQPSKALPCQAGVLSLLQCLCSALLPPTAGERAALTLYLSALNDLEPFAPSQTKIALYWLHSVIC